MSIRAQYEQHGVAGYYAEHAGSYANPHAHAVVSLLHQVWDERWTSGIDLACGDGLVTKTKGNVCEFIGIDPYLNDRYTQETGRACIRASAQHIVGGTVCLPKAKVIVCSYAFDLIPQSFTHDLLWRLADAADNLVVIRPNKKVIDHLMWSPLFKSACDRTHVVVYKKSK